MADRLMIEHGFARRYLFSTNHRIVGIQFLVLSMMMYITCWWRHTAPDYDKPKEPAAPANEAPAPPA